MHTRDITIGMEDLHLDTCLELVSDSLRRRLIQQVRREPTGRKTVEALVEALHETEPTPYGGERLDREQIRIRLIHIHLPKLDAHGILEYDHERGTVRYHPDERIETVLDALPRVPPRTAP